LPVAGQEVAGDFQAESGRTASDQHGFHVNSFVWVVCVCLLR
jgi:hypothetical protein